MDEDLDALEAALTSLVRVFRRPAYWQDVQQSAKVKIDRPSAYLLSTLFDQEGDCKLHELANKIGVEAPSVTRIVQHLEQERLVARIVDPADRRATRLHPTPRGIKTVVSLRQAKRNYLKTLLERWPVAERKALVRLLKRLADDSLTVMSKPESLVNQ